jgi:N-carbamoyl-L-amino-acid hydrolase
VQGIQGCRWFEFRTFGKAAHAGTTPLESKRDALMAAVEVTTNIYNILAHGDDRLRLTIGRMVIRPGSPNVVPSQVSFSVDLRHPETATLDEVES